MEVEPHPRVPGYPWRRHRRVVQSLSAGGRGRGAAAALYQVLACALLLMERAFTNDTLHKPPILYALVVEVDLGITFCVRRGHCALGFLGSFFRVQQYHADALRDKNECFTNFWEHQIKLYQGLNGTSLCIAAGLIIT